MKCIICKHGVTREGFTTVTITKGESLMVVRNVPAEVCSNCGEAYVDQATAERLSDMAAAAVKEGVQVDVREFVAA